MADKSAIQWTDSSWNPVTGCDRVSPGCKNCYALTDAERQQRLSIGRQTRAGREIDLSAPYMRDGDPKTSGPGFGLMMHPGRLDQPLRWRRPRKIFVNSMSDLFHPEVTDDFLDRVFAVMALARQHTFQVLTKRPERMREYMALRFIDDGRKDMIFGAMAGRLGNIRAASEAWPGWPLPNVWLGTSVENARWRTRIDELRQIPAAVRFLSCEPLLGPLVCPRCGGWGYDVVGVYEGTNEPAKVACNGVTGWHGSHDLDLTGIDWVIVGGESGNEARPMDEQWVRDILAACERQDVARFVKQFGERWSVEHLGHHGHAGNIAEFPADLRIREMPA